MSLSARDMIDVAIFRIGRDSAATSSFDFFRLEPYYHASLHPGLLLVCYIAEIDFNNR